MEMKPQPAMRSATMRRSHPRLLLLTLTIFATMDAAAQPIITKRHHEARFAALHSSAARPSRLLALRGGDAKLFASMRERLSTARFDQTVDNVLAGLGLAGSLALIGALEKPLGMKLFVPPMMASGIIFFSPQTPPSPRGFLSGTLACSTISATVLTLLSRSLPAVAAQGAAAGSLLIWYKATGLIFPPAAVVCVLMAGVPAGQSPLNWVLGTWVTGHACLYASAVGVGVVRSSVRARINQRYLQALGAFPIAELKAVFGQFDTSGDGRLDALELKCALRVACGIDVSLREAKGLIGSVDRNGDGVIDFNEFRAICRDKRLEAAKKKTHKAP